MGRDILTKNQGVIWERSELPSLGVYKQKLAEHLKGMMKKEDEHGGG